MGLFSTVTSLETLWGGASFSGLTSTAEKMIEQAENEIRKRLADRYDVSAPDFQTTTGSVPPMVTTLCEWLALGYLYENTSRGSTESYGRADRYINKAMDNIKEIVSYNADLVDASGDVVSDRPNRYQVLGSSKDYHNTFNEDHPLNWGIDTDKVDDIIDERE